VRDELVPANVVSRKPKLVLKVSPDLDESQLIDIADVVKASKIDGVIVSNTTIQRPANLMDRQSSNDWTNCFDTNDILLAANMVEAGGLSGVPLKSYSLSALRTLRTHLPPSIPLIGCGGITSGADALEFAKAGASMVQVYTGFGYDGAGTCRRIKDQLVETLEREGSSWSEVVQKAVAELSLKERPPTDDVAVRKNGTVEELIAEAQELKSLLDRLGEKMDRDRREKASTSESVIS
jgi:dihydroorotate dehydrogenase